MLDVSFHERRHAARMEDPAYRSAYQRAAREIAQTDAVIGNLMLSGWIWGCPRRNSRDG